MKHMCIFVPYPEDYKALKNVLVVIKRSIFTFDLGLLFWLPTTTLCKMHSFKVVCPILVKFTSFLFC